MQQIDFSPALKVFSRHKNVLAVWVFGSAQEGIIQERSDIDFGVLFVQKPLLDELADLRSDLQDALMFDEIDLVVLNDAHPFLQIEAMRGKRLHCKDEEKVAALVSLAAREYEDAMALLQRGLQFTNYSAQL